MAKPKKKANPNPQAAPKRKAEKSLKRPKLAETADRHLYYQKAVQTPDAEIEFFTKVYKKHRKRKPLTLREDFCGTAFLSSHWVDSDKQRRAIGVDLDAPTLAWGREHNVAALRRDGASRIELHEANVLDGVGDRTDIVCAMNFSYNVFKRREDLKRYFSVVFDKLEDDGVFITEIFGGFEAMMALEEERRCDGFTYIWEQESFNPVDHSMICHIGFSFPDKSRLPHAFSYDWRLWTLPELTDILREVGFGDVEIYWETVDEDGDGTGEFEQIRASNEPENQESWLAYIVAPKP